MSGTSPRPPSSPGGPTRALAFIKNHALKHRLTIERRITDAGFDIVKERQMEFSPDSDREVLEELFGNDAAGIGDAPVWVYVLERYRAIETLQSLMGSEDPEEARQNEPQSLRAVYGIDFVDNAIGGSIDSAAAEAQIAALFASSPPFPTSELPLEDEQGTGTMRSVSSSVLDEIRNQLDQQTDAAYYASSVRSNGGSQPSSSGTPTSGKRANGVSTTGKPIFRARPVPATNVPGSVQPRMTKAAALRMGLAPPESASSRPRGSSTGEIVGKRDFIDTPGHKRSTVIKVASTAAPTIAPRPTKASSLREGKPVEVQRRQSLDVSRTEIFKNVPGHKRTETVEVASVKEPTVKPRTNRSASLRQNKDTAPPSSFMFKGPTAPPLATRRSSSSLKNEEIENKPAAAPRRASIGSRPSSAQLVRPPSVGPPDVAPRTNRSAMLRAAKMNATQPKATRA
ncbi:hypothetical protein PIIN_02872 [Serendipita indica DSM 11827]|uniref:Nucleoside diphosphate kinase n=1 Tax=Serendipita indica (strain DSM 11827) TaxID=1109443 RepID=G4TCH0_SERID|nr:hypothetical protein PIIN_02872 [Serendipita indica DSM 11827]